MILGRVFAGGPLLAGAAPRLDLGRTISYRQSGMFVMALWSGRTSVAYSGSVDRSAVYVHNKSVRSSGLINTRGPFSCALCCNVLCNK